MFPTCHGGMGVWRIGLGEMLTIGLLWHSFISGNLGVGALSDANMRLIEDAAREVLPGQGLRFILFGPRGDHRLTSPEAATGYEYVEVSALRRAAQVRRKLAACDLVFDIGEGDSFSDIYGVKRFAKVAGLKFLVPQMRRRLVLSPQTYGPFNAFWARAIAAAALSRSALVFARDVPSADRARALMRPKRAQALEIATDVAFALPPLPEWPVTFPHLEPGKMHVAINVSGLLYAGGYSGKNQFGLSLDYRALTDALVAAFAVRPDLVLWLVPHVFRIGSEGRESDLVVSRALAAASPKIRLAPQFRDAREAKAFIAAMDLVIAARMHAAIAAVSSGVACVPLSYSPKFQGLFTSLNYPFTIDLKTSGQDEAAQACLAALARLPEMRASAQAAAAMAEANLEPYRRGIRAQLRKASNLPTLEA
ncbi:MAG: polysaccharide pyruvyl transferase family protein [Phaeovulum sp.]|uniref:polysaccharide pyruvyl transferase family protein n=1 Tax=Phaeovulum sp. TaxID=2934796 RepID=UPI00272FE1AB|nr:polysaccharide pyruvyl transferase family protein [Phaeovulum sp.]MDP2063837.1 polysaccharide pyruvyl transferase family protein [Phaeovulum sp.]